MANSQPIGMFDSGVGGTTIFKAVREKLPMENIVYLADSLNAPYGGKSKNKIVDLCLKNTEFLLDKDCKLIIAACNTATTNAITELRDKFDIPFIGVEPAIKPAAFYSTKSCVAVLATPGTLASHLFDQTSGLFAKNKEIIKLEGRGLVEAIEEGRVDAGSTFERLKNILAPVQDRDIDYLVLGCTHFPYLRFQLKKLLPSHVKIIDSGEAVAEQTYQVLKTNRQLTETQSAKSVFYTNKNPEILREFVSDNAVKIEHLHF